MVNLQRPRDMTVSQQTIIDEVVRILQSRYGDDRTGHDWFHLARVWTMAKRLARGKKVNHFVLQMAALLHDVDDYKFKPVGEDPLLQTKKILDQFSLPQSDYDLICDISSHVSYKGAGVPDNQPTLEGQIVQDADRLDGIGAIGIARCFVYNGYKGNVLYDPLQAPHTGMHAAEYTKLNSTAINHFYEKLLLVYDRLHTPEAKRIGRKRHTYLQNYLKEFLAEWEGKQ